MTACTRRSSPAAGARPSLLKMRPTWDSTVRLLRCKRLLIPGLERPSAINDRTSSSRTVSSSRPPSCWERFINAATTISSMAVPPAATRRSASMNVAIEVTRSFKR